MGDIPLSPRHGKEFKKRVYYLLTFFIFALLVLLFRIGFLQIVQHDRYSLTAQGNSEQSYPIFPRRGEVYDRNGMHLIKNRGYNCVTLTLGFIKRNKREIVKKRLSKLLGMSVKKINRRIVKKQKRDRNINTPVIIKSGVPKSIIIKIKENYSKYPGVDISVMSRRIYTSGEELAHVLGFIRSISERDYQNRKHTGRYRPISDIGKMGIERIYDLQLRGREGRIVKLVDAYSKPLSNIDSKYKAPIPGKTLLLTIDKNLQTLAYTALGKRRGAVIITKPATGEVLAIVSSPSFDSNMFFGNPNLRKEYAELKRHPDKPLFNRALAGFYPPGSTFKLVTAAAGLNEGRISPNTVFNCTGRYELGDRIFRCWDTHGRIDLTEAIRKSCTYYFYRVGEKIGYETIYKYAKLFNFAQPSNIDLTGERVGIIPNNRWKIRRFGEKWYEGDTLNMAVGQGYIMVTPLQVHDMVSTIANDGILMKPNILKKIINTKNSTVEKVVYPKVLKKRFLKKEVIKYLQGAMRLVAKNGTAAWVATIAPNVKVAGKTGTAQNPFGAPHAWFTSYGGWDKDKSQRVAITVMVENQEAGGGGAAAPIAAILYNYVYQEKSFEECIRDIKNILKIKVRTSESTETSAATRRSAVERRRVRELYREQRRRAQSSSELVEDENIED
jgi:penicillin-binding protein 2